MVKLVSIPYSFSSGSTAKSSEVNTNFNTVAAAIVPTAIFTIDGTLPADTNVPPAIIVPKSLTIIKVYAYVKTAPTGASIIMDINKNGTSIWNSTQANRITIAASSQNGTQTSFDTTALVEGDILTLDVDQVGSTIPGSSVTVEIKTT